jgi:hypothetical protein
VDFIRSNLATLEVKGVQDCSFNTITITINPNAKDVMGAKNNTPKILAMFGLMFIIPIIIAVGLIITMMATREVNPIILVGAVIGIGLFFIVLIVMMVLAGDIMAIVNP